MDDGDAFQRLFEHLFSIFTVTDEMKKLRSGFLLKEILDRFSSKSESVLMPDRSLWFYFAHGDILSSLFSSFFLWNFRHSTHELTEFFFTFQTSPLQICWALSDWKWYVKSIQFLFSIDLLFNTNSFFCIAASDAATFIVPLIRNASTHWRRSVCSDFL